MRVRNLIELARPVGDALLERFAEIARQEQLLAVKDGAKSDTDPQWAAPAISEAWCNARLGLAKGSLNRHSAVAIIAAVETSPRRRRWTVSAGLDHVEGAVLSAASRLHHLYSLKLLSPQVAAL